MNLIKRTIDIQEKKLVKIYIHVCTQSMGSPLVISHILAELHPETQLCINGLSKSAQTFTVGFVKLLSTHPIHIVGDPPPL